MFKSFAALLSPLLRDSGACVRAGEADRLCALVFDKALAMGLPRVAVHVHKVGPPVAWANLKETINTAVALVSFPLFLRLVKAMQWAARVLVRVSFFVAAASFGWFYELLSSGLGLKLGQIAMLEVIIVLECLVAIAECRIIIADPGISFDADLAG